MATPCDLTEAAAIEELRGHLPESVDVLIHSTGGNVEIGSEAPTNLGAVANNWKANFALNVLSAVLLTEAVSDRFARHARLITIGSIAAHTGAGSYGAAKSALRAWTLDQAEELGANVGGTANLVSPGLTMDTGFFKGLLTEDRIERLAEATLVNRVSSIDDVVACCAFLWSEAGRQLTGQSFHVNGGAYTSL